MSLQGKSRGDWNRELNRSRNRRSDRARPDGQSRGRSDRGRRLEKKDIDGFLVGVPFRTRMIIRPPPPKCSA